MFEANNRQVAGTHYRTLYQHWDFVADAGLGYFEGQITKYLARHRKKNGAQDVEKAMHFAQKWRELALAGKVRPSGVPLLRTEPLISRFLNENHLIDQEATAVTYCSTWFLLEHIDRAIRCIQRILDGYDAEAGPGYVNQDR